MSPPVVFSVTLRSRSGLSIYRDFNRLDATTVIDFLPFQDRLAQVVDAFREAGFGVEAVTEAGCTFSCGRDHFERTFRCKLSFEPVRYIRSFKRSVYQVDRPLAPPFLKDEIEAVFFPKPSFELGDPSAFPPELPYYHIWAGDLRKISSPRGRLSPHTGAGVQATIVDTGAFPHPYFHATGAKLRVVPAIDAFDADRDERGHGTGMTSVFLSQAPRADVTVIKMASEAVSYALPAFQAAVRQPGRLISCSWGTIGFEPHLYLEIANAVRLGKLVVFSSGNGSFDSERAFFASISHPDVISVGGCFVRGDRELMLSDMSSSFESELFPGRTCPDVLGVCGLKPFGQWILMPCEPASIYDHDNGERDGTGQDDGWFVSSGTSAAAAYVSGIIALGLAIRPTLTLSELRHALQASAVPVTEGESNMKFQATGRSPDLATGYGFVDEAFVEFLLSRRS